ncbi:MAG: 4-(cytidine 5'-diphospho)-2-C-methyl-D-erythritol kinase [bacterium]|nr:4-(cytidine 5'-diphospho)-2-C-methyl-D-erythritol kinase [bacterium]
MKHNERINSIHLLCPAKINLGLKVGSRRTDGYHEIRTIFQSVNFYDELKVIQTENQHDELTIVGNQNLPSNEDNLVLKAVHLFRNITKSTKTYSIELNKRIPVGAGLGGGSSDAAGAFIAVNLLNESPLNDIECLNALLKLGSDCPFFYHGGLQYAKGRGEILFKIPRKLSEYFILWCPPNVPISTKYAYEVLKRDLTYSLQDFIFLNQFLNSASWWSRELKNDFEDVISPQIKNWNEVKEFFYSFQAKWISMTGSGSTMVVCFENYSDAKNAYEHSFVKDECIIVQPVQYGVQIK